MENPKRQIVDRIKQATNILVTVSANPSVDQLAACIGLTLLLNKLDKHGTAVFSGTVPSTIEFLEPEKTLEKNTDSLRDFIIALDKSKADKLRYKVEDKVVRIFITPYRTSLSERDLEFSQGDFNVEMVIALGVQEQKDLDQAITAHGRILHDATVVSINSGHQSALGTIHWQDGGASSLSEMVTALGDELDKTLLDRQISTALLTGIVAETARFSNPKTTPTTMTLSAELMAAGANPQLVAAQLEEPVQSNDTNEDKPESPIKTDQSPAKPEPPKASNGVIAINHDPEPVDIFADADADHEIDPQTQIRVDRQGTLTKGDGISPDVKDKAGNETEAGLEAEQQATPASPNNTDENTSPKFVTEPPTLSGTLTANSRPEDSRLDPAVDPLTLLPQQPPLLDHTDNPPAPMSVDSLPSPVDATPQPPTLPVSPPAPSPTPEPSQTHEQAAPTVIHPEESANEESAIDQPPVEAIDEARNAVEQAIAGSQPDNLKPLESLGAQPVFDAQLDTAQAPTPVAPNLPPSPVAPSFSSAPVPDVPVPPAAPSSTDQSLDTLTMPVPPATLPQPQAAPVSSAPPVPPPLMPMPPVNPSAGNSF